MSTRDLTREALAAFSGSGQFYRNPLFPNVIFTEGVEFLTQNGCAWLVDDISAHICSAAFNAAAEADPRIERMHFWHLDVHEQGGATLAARADRGEPAFITQDIPFTDAPFDLDVWAAKNVIQDREYQTLMLPSEY